MRVHFNQGSSAHSWYMQPPNNTYFYYYISMYAECISPLLSLAIAICAVLLFANETSFSDETKNKRVPKRNLG